MDLEYIFTIPTLTELVEKNKVENEDIDKIKQVALEKVKKHYGKEAYEEIEIETEKRRKVDNSHQTIRKRKKKRKYLLLKRKKVKLGKKHQMANCVSELNNLIESFLGRKEITLDWMKTLKKCV